MTDLMLVIIKGRITRYYGRSTRYKIKNDIVSITQTLL